MKGLLGWAIAAATLLCVFLVVQWERVELTSPGPLHSAHRDHPLLQGADGCAQCHSGGEHDLATSCLQCHDAIERQLADRVGLHGAADPARNRDCGACHIEHVGDSIALVGPHAFAAVGVVDRDAYDHRHVADFGLVGKHVRIACAECHEQADAAVLTAGQHRFLGLSQDCTSCHEDIHRGEFGRDCASCHGQEHAFASVARFEHDPRFELTGAHLGVACKACHEPGSLDERAPRTSARTCADCHTNPHVADATGGFAALRIDRTGDCAQCHDTERFDLPHYPREQHAEHAFELLGPHREVACATCHGDAERAPRWDPARRDAVGSADCAACHESPHRPDFLAAAAGITGAKTDGGCTACHAFDDPSFALPHAEMSASVHAASGFPLEAPHADVACASCHAAERGGKFRERFPGRDASRCAVCHGDPHDGQFDARDAGGTRCQDCHAETHFVPTTFDHAAHAATAFPLEGAHAAVACSTCHSEALRRSGATVRRFRGLDTDCASCHEDPHGGRFDRAGMPRDVDGRAGCARCHGTDAFTDVSWQPAAHATWTGHALRGAHASVDCAACHGQPFVAAAPTDCASCHQDVHAGQFVRDGRNDCTRCHTEEKTFRELTFDHTRDTRFPLDRNHARLACSDCHRARRTRNGDLVVRYRPLGRECGDCHKTGGRR